MLLYVWQRLFGKPCKYTVKEKSRLSLQGKFSPSELVLCCFSISWYPDLLVTAGWNRGSGREAPHPFSHSGPKEERDWGHAGRFGEQKIQTDTPESAWGQGEPAQVRRRTHPMIPETKAISPRWKWRSQIQMWHSSATGGKSTRGRRTPDAVNFF